MSNISKLRFDQEQRFTCARCARCCRAPWEIIVSKKEVEAYRKADASRWFRESDSEKEGAHRDPFEPLGGSGEIFKIRKRNDGACGFLSPDNRCRIHEELGAIRKPLPCRVFPFRFHSTKQETIATISRSCPTVAAGGGAPVLGQENELRHLAKDWFDQYPQEFAPLMFYETRPIGVSSAQEFRSILRKILERRTPDAQLDLAENVLRIAVYCEDVTRHRVLRLNSDDFDEYLKITGRYAAENSKPVVSREPPRLTRLFFRGFLFVVVALKMRLARTTGSSFHYSIGFPLLRVFGHLHGILPPFGDINIAALRSATLNPKDPKIEPLLFGYLRSCIETLGTGRLPMIEELGLAVAQLNAACGLAAMHAHSKGSAVICQDDLLTGLTEASDLSHANLKMAFFSGIDSLLWFVNFLKVASNNFESRMR